MKRWTPRAVLFDLDGTLVDTLGDLAHALNATLAGAGLPGHSLVAVRGFIGHGVDNLLRRALPEARRRDDVADLRRVFDSHYAACNGRHATIYPGVHETLRAVDAAGIAMACVTNKPSLFARPLLDGLGLGKFLPLLIGGDPGRILKPRPEPLLDACAQLGIAPQQALLLGDSSADAQAARAAGMPVVLMRYGYNELAAAEIDCDAIVDRMDQALALIALDAAG